MSRPGAQHSCTLPLFALVATLISKASPHLMSQCREYVSGGIMPSWGFLTRCQSPSSHPSLHQPRHADPAPHAGSVINAALSPMTSKTTSDSSPLYAFWPSAVLAAIAAATAGLIRYEHRRSASVLEHGARGCDSPCRP